MCYSCRCYKLSTLPFISVKVLTIHKYNNFPCFEVLIDIKGGLHPQCTLLRISIWTQVYQILVLNTHLLQPTGTILAIYLITTSRAHDHRGVVPCGRRGLTSFIRVGMAMRGGIEKYISANNPCHPLVHRVTQQKKFKCYEVGALKIHSKFDIQSFFGQCCTQSSHSWSLCTFENLHHVPSKKDNPLKFSVTQFWGGEGFRWWAPRF